MPENTPKMVSALRLTEIHWRFLALEIQEEAVVMFNGPNRLAARERKGGRKAA